jgi:hypothetical protein
MRHVLVGATLLLLALAATFGVATVLESRATAPLRTAPTPVAGEPAKPDKLSPGEPGRSPSIHRVGFQR